MSLENILSKIKEETDREIEQIISRAKGERDRRLREAKIEIEREKEQKIRKAKRAIENRKKAEIARIKQRERARLIQEKERIIRECFDKAIERLKAMKGKDYEKIVERLMKSAREEIGEDCIIVPSRKEDIKVARKLKLKVDDKMIESVGGFIAKSEDGKIIIDNRFESIMERKEKEIRSRIGKILFGG